jgi:tripartite-type tricarboxylate transporter receptor subunit TctC
MPCTQRGFMKRRTFLYLATSAATFPATPRQAWSQIYPSRPVRIVVGFAAGGGVDVTARLMAQWLSQRLGRPFTVENRPGANSNIATEVVVRAPPDGYTLLMVNAANAASTTLYDNLSFNFIHDIAPVASVMRVPLVVVVNPSAPIKAMPEFIAYVKANPAKVTMASGGNGAPEHMAGELFKMMTGVSMLHVPHRGAAPALTDLLAGQVQVMFAAMPAAIEYIRAGSLRALAVTTTARSELLPGLPTLSEFVPGYEASQWYGLGAPRSTPPEIICGLNGEINASLVDPRMKARLADLGGIIVRAAPADFGKLIADETEKWGNVIRVAGIKAE